VPDYQAHLATAHNSDSCTGKQKVCHLKDSLTRFAHMFLVSIDRSHVAAPYGAGSFVFQISFLCRIFRFSHLGVGSLLCEWSWTIRLPQLLSCPVLGSHNGAHANVVLGGKYLKINTVPQPGAPETPYLEFYYNVVSEANIYSLCKTNRKMSCLRASNWFLS
jgi:hypothetical protein